MDGRFVPWDEAKVHVMFHGIHYGTNVFEGLADVCRRAVAENDLEDGYVRPIAMYGLGGMNFSFKDNKVHVAVAVWPWGAYLGEEGMRRGIRLKTVSWVKTPTNAAPSGAKIAGNYVNSCLAFQEAMRAGFDEALMLNV